MPINSLQQKLPYTSKMKLTQTQLQPMRHQLEQLRTRHIAQSLVSGVGNVMQMNICIGYVEVKGEKSQVGVGERDRDRGDGDGESRLMEIMVKKDQIRRELEGIQREEEALKQAKLTHSRTAGPTQYFKSQLTAEDIQKLKKLKADERKFQKLLVEKTQQYEQRIKKHKEQEQLSKQQERRQKYQLKKQQIEKTIQLIEKRKMEREGRKEEERKRLIQIKSRKKLHEEWEEKWRAVEEEEEKKKEELKEELKRIRKITHEDIKQHERKYQETMKIQKESRMRQSIVSGTDHQSYRSVFLDQIKQEQRKQKQIEELRKGVPKEFLSKIKQYGEKVKTHHKPTIKPKDKDEVQENSEGEKIQGRSMSLFETHKKGNQYMKEANTQMMEALKKRDQNTPRTGPKVAQEQAPKYKNYLKQLKKPDSEHPYKKSSELSQIRELLKKQNLAPEQKFYQAKLLAQKIQNRKAIRSPQGLLNSINAKIEILKQVDI